jgi:hypothetical protein
LVRYSYKETNINEFTFKGIQQYITQYRDMDQIVLFRNLKEDGGIKG